MRADGGSVGGWAVKSFSSARGCVTRVLGSIFVASLSVGLLSSRAAAAPSEVPASTPAPAAGQVATDVERENWRKKIMRTPQPTSGCFTATFPETDWRKVTCNTPPHNLYLPKHRGIRPEQVGGGGGADFSAEVTGHISEAIGLFDSVTGVVSESNSNGAADTYTLQLNTQPFKTNTCAGSPGGVEGDCRGWQQFIYNSSTGTGFIQYWLLSYGPIGTSCPIPKGANCLASGQQAFSDGWCPATFANDPDVYCVINAENATAPAKSEPITSLQQLSLWGLVAGKQGPDDEVFWSVLGTLFNAPGNNYFPDLADHWQKAEFNVFGDGGNRAANFNIGSPSVATLVVRTVVNDGVNVFAPICGRGTPFTGETNDLTLVGSPALVTQGTPAIVFTESSAAGGTSASCTTIPTGQWLVPLMALGLGR
jgi:hypothetical protein